MDLSPSSTASPNPVNDGTIHGVAAAASTPPPTRRSKRKAPEFNPDDESNPYAKFYRQHEQSCSSHRRLHSPRRIRECLRNTTSPCDPSSVNNASSPSSPLLTQPPDIIFPPNIQDDTSTIHDEYTMDPEERQIVLDAMRVNWGISTPHPFQVKAIHHGLFHDGSTQYIIAKTGYGKSVIPATIASVRRGIALYMVPLLGLGSDLVNKSNRPERGIESYHVDEHKGEDASLLAERLLALTEKEAEFTTIQLFASPNALSPESSWARVFQKLAKRGMFSVFCIDEAHSVNLQKHFRPEFIPAASFLKSLYDAQPHKSHSDFKNVISMFVRAMQQPKKDVRKTAIEDFFQTNNFLFCPMECYHIGMERYFEDPNLTHDSEPCGDFCSFCTDGHKEITGSFSKDKLANILLGKFFSSNSLTPDALIKYLKQHKDDIFTEGNVPERSMGPIHGLAIQLLCKGSIVPYVDDKYSKLIGTAELNSSHIRLKGGLTTDKFAIPIMNTTDAWQGMNCI